jgi:hypothetical protein
VVPYGDKTKKLSPGAAGPELMKKSAVTARRSETASFA